MAVKTIQRVGTSGQMGAEWVKVDAQQVVALHPERADYLMRDVSGWPRWDPGVRRVEHLEGGPGTPGAISRLVVGIGPVPVRLVQMLVGASEGTTVFGGGGGRWRFIDVIRLTPHTPSTTRVDRTLEIRLAGALRWLRPLIRAYATRHLRRALSALA